LFSKCCWWWLLLFGHCVMLSRRCLWKCLWRSYEILSFVLKFIWCLVNWVLMLNFMFVKFESFVSFRRILDMENEMLSAEHVWICGSVNKKIKLVLEISLIYRWVLAQLTNAKIVSRISVVSWVWRAPLCVCEFHVVFTILSTNNNKISLSCLILETSIMTDIHQWMQK
jgi:hypothetical protein